MFGFFLRGQLAGHFSSFSSPTSAVGFLWVVCFFPFAGWLSHNEWKQSDSTAQRKLNAPTLQKDNRKQCLTEQKMVIKWQHKKGRWTRIHDSIWHDLRTLNMNLKTKI